MRSKESAEISTPAPNAMTAAITRCGSLTNAPIAAPSTRADPLSRPHRPAWMTRGMRWVFLNRGEL
jgi:hypothetical protein